MNWYLITALLCCYGFFKEFRPIEPFLTPYLEDRNFTNQDIYGEMLPFWTYSNLIILIPIFLLTDVLRYKPVILFESLSYAVTWGLLIFTNSIKFLRLSMCFYGFAAAAEVAYYSYIYAAVDPEHYKKATSYVSAIITFGQFFAYGLSQLLISTRWTDYQILLYITWAGSILIFIPALFLPWISYNRPLIKEDRETLIAPDSEAPETVDTVSVHNPVVPETYKDFVKLYVINIWTNFKSIYSLALTWKWSLWWALATCGYYQVEHYAQNLWIEIQNQQESTYNGAVEGASMLLSSIAAACMQFINCRWEVYGEIVLATASGINCVLLIFMSQTTIIWIAYSFYIICNAVYQLMFTISMYIIAKDMSTESYGLVFGFNNFIAIILQTVLTLSVVDDNGFALDIRTQFFVYGCYYGGIALIFVTMGAYTLWRTFCRRG